MSNFFYSTSMEVVHGIILVLVAWCIGRIEALRRSTNGRVSKIEDRIKQLDDLDRAI